MKKEFVIPAIAIGLVIGIIAPLQCRYLSPHEIVQNVPRYQLVMLYFYQTVSKELKKQNKARYKELKKRYKTMKKSVKKVAKDLPEVIVAQVNLTKHPAMGTQYNVTVTPTILLVHRSHDHAGNAIDRIIVRKTGFMGKKELLSMVKRNFGNEMNALKKAKQRLKELHAQRWRYEAGFFYAFPFSYGYPYCFYCHGYLRHHIWCPYYHDAFYQPHHYPRGRFGIGLYVN